MRPPCEGHDVFTNPQGATQQQRAEAIEMCHHCPLRIQCALDATTAGTTLDRERVAAAVDVIQAGVWLTGEQQPLVELHGMIGSTPAIKRGKRAPTPRVCVDCGRAMIPRDKTIHLTPDIVTHAARGYCRTCYARRKRQGQMPVVKPKHQALLGWQANHQTHMRRTS